MRKVLVVALALVVLTGCPKKKDKDKGATGSQTGGPAPNSTTGAAGTPSGPGPSSTVVVQGSGGAVQGTRMAAYRAIKQADLDQLHIFLESASGPTGTLPTREQTEAMLQKEAPNIARQIKDGAIVLTGVRKREGTIWAYTAEPQSIIGVHLMLSTNRVERIAPQDLKQRLQQQQGQ
jgi:hypothetical protein